VNGGRATRPRVGVLTVPYFRLGLSAGGAEAIAEKVALLLSSTCEVVIFHGKPERQRRSLGKQPISRNLWRLEAFAITTSVRDHGVLDVKRFYSEALRELMQCETVFSFERAIAGVRIRRVCVIGGIAYPHCRECFASEEWDALVVPSQFVADYAERYVSHNSQGRIRTIPNGIDVETFCPMALRSRVSDSFTLLVPARPDSGKGHSEAIAFAKLCQAACYDVRLICFRQRSCFTNEDFYERLLPSAGNTVIEIRNWAERAEMPQAYRDSDLTLCLGSMPEGFGLAAAESIACGTPVLAQPIGSLRDLVPPGCGMKWADDRDLQGIAVRLRETISILKVECATKGTAHIRASYSENQMASAYLALLQ
jgi:glycosyltransferase involved in cell wall biosynthesis